MLSHQLQALASETQLCGIEQQLENEVIKKASVEGDVQQVATEREHQPMAWLCADMDDQDKSIGSTLWCVVYQKYETGCVGSNTSPGHGSMVLATKR